MKIRLSAHGAYHHQYHVVWIPKYRKKILKGEIKQYLEKGLFDVQRFHPDVEIETFSIQVDHVHWRNEFWSVGFFSSTVGIDEEVIKRYVEFQEKVDTGTLQLGFGF
jgi:putative transposase